MNGFLLSGFLMVQNPVPFADPQREALRYGAKALFVELDLKDYFKELEKYVPPEVKPYAPYVGIAGRLISEKRISYTWSF